MTEWRLWRGDVLLGTLGLREIDLPRFRCAFESTPAFEAIRPLFDEEYRPLRAGETDARIEAYGGMDALGLRLEDVQRSAETAEPLLHVPER